MWREWGRASGRPVWEAFGRQVGETSGRCVGEDLCGRQVGDFDNNNRPQVLLIAQLRNALQALADASKNVQEAKVLRSRLRYVEGLLAELRD